MEKINLKPSIYCLFVLLRNGTWEQPVYRLRGNGWTEQLLEAMAMNSYPHSLYACAVQEDLNAPNSAVEDLGECP